MENEAWCVQRQGRYEEGWDIEERGGGRGKFGEAKKQDNHRRKIIFVVRRAGQKGRANGSRRWAREIGVG